MPSVKPREMVEAIVTAFRASGHIAMLNSGIQTHPRKFVVIAPDGSCFSVWVYIWTLTHGGRPNLPNEYRIQMTTVSSPLEMNPDGFTALLGFDPERGLFAGFDCLRHQNFTSGSPSVQIDIVEAEKALSDGLSFDRKSNDEIAVGVKPDQLADYVIHSVELHKYGKQRATLQLLRKATELADITDAELSGVSDQRKRIIQQVSKLARDARFRRDVMAAYSCTCAVTGVQLRLVDAAHILPIGAPGSTDQIQNGLALAPTIHRAYDSGLIYLNGSYHMKINPAREAELVAMSLSDGIEAIKSHLGKIALPDDQNHWPSKAFIRQANRVRGIPS